MVNTSANTDRVIIVRDAFWIVGSGSGMPVISYDDLRFHIPDLTICVMWNCTFGTADEDA